MSKYNWKDLALLVLACLAVTGLTIVIDEDGVRVEKRTKTVAELPPEAIAVDGPDKDAKPDDPIILGDDDQKMAQEFAVGAAKGTNDLDADNPKGEPLAGDVTGPIAKLKAPFASDSVPGCRTRTLTTNWSYRAPGTRILAIGLHYTAGRDVPKSRSEVDGLTAFGNRSASRVSWAINLDKDGNCDYNVPFRYKSWTIGDLNSETINFEIHGRGEAPYLRPAGYRKLARIYLDIHRSYPAIKLRLAHFSNCHVTVSGIGTHWQGGACSGGHVDIKPLDIVAVIRQLRLYVGKELEHRLRVRHRSVHKLLRDHRCAPEEQSRSVNCKSYYAKNHSIHAEARKKRFSLA